MSRIIIIEDQLLIAENLKQIVASFQYDILAVCHDFSDSYAKIEEHKPDIILVDINLGKDSKNGIELVKAVKEHLNSNIGVIFITANSDSETIAEASKVGPDGYIVKPFQKDTIHSTIEIVLSNKSRNAADKNAYVEVRKKGAWEKILFTEILFIKSDGVYSDIFTKDGKKYTKREYLKSLVEMLPEEDFIRPHKSYIVRIDSIDSYTSRHLNIGGVEVPIGRTHRDEVFSKIRKQ